MSKLKKIKKVLNNQYSDIMDTFDFDTVYKTMVFLKWDVTLKEGSEIYNVKKTARYVIERCVDEFEKLYDTTESMQHCFVYTGGFKATIDMCNFDAEDSSIKPWVRLNLSFIITDTLNDGEEIK